MRKTASRTQRVESPEGRTIDRCRGSARKRRADRHRRADRPAHPRRGFRHGGDVGTCWNGPVTGEVPRPDASATGGRRGTPGSLLPAIAGTLAALSCGVSDTAEIPVVSIAEHSLSVLSRTDSPLWDVLDVVDVDGTIWALTASAPFVHGFEPTGELTARFGKSGEGPGDFRFPYALWPGKPGGALTVWDQGAFRALTFSSSGDLLSSLKSPVMGAIRADLATVTFGNPFRAVRVPGGIVATRYDSGVNHPDDLWNGGLLRVPDDGGDPAELIDFALDLPGALMRSSATLLVPVPLWDGCPDGRIAVLDPIARTLFLIDSGAGRREEREAIVLPWHSPHLDGNARVAYMIARIRAETGEANITEPEILSAAREAAENAEAAFAREGPIGVDLKCAPGKVWIQEFDRVAHPLGYGPSWRTVSIDPGPVTFSRVVFPPGFQPHRFSASSALGVVGDPEGRQRVAAVPLPPFSRQGPSPETPPTPTYPVVAANQGEPHR